jgi:glyoxylase I family protein
MGSAIARLQHLGIVITDLEKARHFFCDLLELPVLATWRSDERAVTIIMLEAGDAHLELLVFDDPEEQVPEGNLSYQRPGLRHLAFAVEDIELVWARLEEAGVPLVLSPRPGNYFRRFLFCRGPEGILIELVEE